MIRIRRIIQVLSILFFLFLLFVSVYPLSILPGLVDFYMRLSPLQMAATWLNTGGFIASFVPAVVLLALALVFGRFFCGWICPLGVTLDATDRALAPRRSDDSREPLKWKKVKYGILVVILVAAYFEANLAGWLDPISIVTRTYVQVVLPAFEFVTNLIFRGLYPAPLIGDAARGAHSFFKTALYALQQPAFHGMAATALIFLAIAFAVYFNRRFWCRFLCPLGAMLGLLSRYSVFKRVVDAEKCTGCNKCVRNCRMGAILEGGDREYRGECIECFTCLSVCPEGAISFAPARRGAAVEPVNLSRRGFMWAFGAGLAAVPLVRLTPGASKRRPIRPPGAGGEDRFMQTCLRCGQCLRVCPTNGLQPSWFDAGLEGLWTPELVPRIGYCEFNCNLCGAVCPSGAIKQLDEETKKSTVIGMAYIDRNLCIPWARNKNCLVCEEHCPVPDKAIKLKEETVVDVTGAVVVVKRPYVVEAECIGCGICETKCPLIGVAAIRVTGIMPQELKTAAAAAGSVERLLPNDVGEWKAVEPARVFERDNLFDFIDGGAEVYYEYGFSRATTREYELNGDAVTVDVFEMSDPDAAFGIFSYERGGSRAAFGDFGDISEGMLLFRQAAYYIKINYFGESDYEPALELFGNKVSALIGERADAPRILFIPPDSADAFSSAVLVAGPLTMRGFYPLGADGAFGFDRGARGLIYNLHESKCMVLLFPDIETADAAVNSVEESLREKGFSESKEPTGFAVSLSDSGTTINYEPPAESAEGARWTLCLTR